MNTSIRVLACVLAASIGAGAAFALSQAEATTIAQKVIALNDPQATAAFKALDAKGVFKVDGTAGDAAREVAFRVLDLNDAALNQSFTYLKSKGVFEAAPNGQPTAADQLALDETRSAAAQCKAAMDRINPLVDEYNASWIPGRLRIRKEISATIEQARQYLDRAQAAIGRVSDRTTPAAVAMASSVESTRKEFNSYIEWWNTTFANQ